MRFRTVEPQAAGNGAPSFFQVLVSESLPLSRVGEAGFEPATTSTQSSCTTGLCDSPWRLEAIFSMTAPRRVVSLARRHALRPRPCPPPRRAFTGTRKEPSQHLVPVARFSSEAISPPRQKRRCSGISPLESCSPSTIAAGYGAGGSLALCRQWVTRTHPSPNLR